VEYLLSGCVVERVALAQFKERTRSESDKIYQRMIHDPRDNIFYTRYVTSATSWNLFTALFQLSTKLSRASYCLMIFVCAVKQINKSSSVRQLDY
jgi:hypothetical protein